MWHMLGSITGIGQAFAAATVLAAGMIGSMPQAKALLLFGVLYVFFTKIAHVHGSHLRGQQHYGAQLLGSIVLFTFFSEATGGAVTSVVSQEAVVRKIQFPRMVIPLSIVLGAMFNLGLNLIVVLIFALASGVRPMLTWVELPLILAVLAVLATGMAMLLSSVYVYFRDLSPIWEVISQILFYSSPVVIPFSAVQTHFSHLLVKAYLLNPLSAVFQQFRHAMVNNYAANVPRTMGPVWLIAMLAIVAAIFAMGFVVFNRTAPSVAENL